MKQSALRSALSAKVADGELIGIEALAIDGGTPSTKAAVTALKALPLTREVRVKRYEDDERVDATREEMHKVLLIVPEYDETLLKSVRNLPNVTLRYAPNFSVRDIVAAGRVVLAQGAVARIEENLTRPNGAIAVEEPAVLAVEEPVKPPRKRAAKKETVSESEEPPAVEAEESAESVTGEAEAAEAPVEDRPTPEEGAS
jgi:hypothetical protein